MVLRSSYYIRLPSTIFSCGQLMFLELQACYIPHLPVGFAGFPALQKLTLITVMFPENGASVLEAIIAGSPLLDALKLSYSDIHGGTCGIEAPNLRTLTINAMGDNGWRIGELSRLDHVTFDLVSYVDDHDLGGFLAGVAHVRILARSTSYHPINDDREQVTEANAEVQNAQWTNGMCASLQDVKMNAIGYLSNEMFFIELVLSKATALCKMSINLRHGSLISMSNKTALSKLSTHRRASPHAQVFIKGFNSTQEAVETIDLD